MKIRELIEKLNKFEPDMTIVVKSEGGINIVTDVEVDRLSFINEAGLEEKDLVLIIK